jgi:hypothetical protein
MCHEAVCRSAETWAELEAHSEGRPCPAAVGVVDEAIAPNLIQSRRSEEQRLSPV